MNRDQAYDALMKYVMENLPADPELVCVDHSDRLTEEQASMLLAGDWEGFYSDTMDWESDSRWESAKVILDELVEEALGGMNLDLDDDVDDDELRCDWEHSEEAVEAVLALELPVPVVVILSGSIDPTKHHPRPLADLRERVVESGGLLVSTFGDEELPSRERNIKRNRTIGNATDVAMIAESSIRGGAMLIAETVAGAGRHVLAAPVPITSGLSGTNRLIKDGTARLTTSPDDMIAALGHYAGVEW